MREPSTLQRVLLQVAEILRPLEQTFAQGRAQASLAELGIVVSAAQAASLSSPAQALGARATAMLEDAAALVTAIDDDDGGQIAALSSRSCSCRRPTC